MKALILLSGILGVALQVSAESVPTSTTTSTVTTTTGATTTTPTTAAKVVVGKDKVVYEKSTKLDFDGRSLDGDIVNPNGSAVDADKNLYFDPLYEERKDFKNELKRSSGAI